MASLVKITHLFNILRCREGYMMKCTVTCTLNHISNEGRCDDRTNNRLGEWNDVYIISIGKN
jgi:hypothetical protein